MRNLIVKLLYILAFIYPWGRFFENIIFSNSMRIQSSGIATLITLLIILLSFFSKYFVRGFNMVQSKIALLTFLTLTFFATTLSNTPEKIFSDFINLIVYFILIFAIVGVKPSIKEITKTVKVLMYSTFLMSSLSLLDYLNFINIPYLNNGISNVLKESSYVFDLTGPFLIRTEIGYHLTLVSILPILFIFSKKESFLSKCLYLFMFGILIITGYLSNNRAIFLAIATLMLYLINLRFNLFRSVESIMILLTIAFLYAIIPNIFSIEYNQYLRDVGNSSDMTRLWALKSTLIDITNMPIGAGLSRPYIDETNEYRDVHNSFTYLLRAGGFIGFIMLVKFFLPIIKKIYKSQFSQSELVIILPIMSLLIFGIFHTSIQVTSFWVIIGMIFSIQFNQKIIKKR